MQNHSGMSVNFGRQNLPLPLYEQDADDPQEDHDDPGSEPEIKSEGKSNCSWWYILAN